MMLNSSNPRGWPMRFFAANFFYPACVVLGCLSAPAWANSAALGNDMAHQEHAKAEPAGHSQAPVDPHYVKDYPPVSVDLLNVVVEVPAGTNEKWEVDKTTGALALESVFGKPRVVAYLGYPGNYGMVPQTLSPKAEGGDGDPLDVLLIGLPAARGEVAEGKLIGVLKFLDQGEQDDKLLAVMPGSALSRVESIEQLKREFPGVVAIVKTWFENYKGAGKMKFMGFGSRAEALAILDKAVSAYKVAHPDTAKPGL